MITWWMIYSVQQTEYIVLKRMNSNKQLLKYDGYELYLSSSFFFFFFFDNYYYRQIDGVVMDPRWDPHLLMLITKNSGSQIVPLISNLRYLCWWCFCYNNCYNYNYVDDIFVTITVIITIMLMIFLLQLLHICSLKVS